MSDHVPLGTLTPTEVRTIRMLADGMTVAAIAKHDHMSSTGCSMRIIRAARRLGLHGVTHVRLVVECLRRGLLDEPGKPGMPVLPRSWHGLNDNTLVIEVTNANDAVVNLWVAAPNDGPSVLLSADQARAVGADLIRRGDLIKPRPVQPIGERP
jgi:DNA-binding CsgD family transcriptional regulator